MQLITWKLPKDHNLFFESDTHDGSCLSSQSGWEHFIDMVHSPYDGCKNNFVAEGSDMIEAICVDDKRFSPEKLTEKLPLAQTKLAIKKREPIKKLLLDVLLGNHCFSLWKFGNLAEYIANELGVPYGTYTAKLNIQDKKGRPMYKVFHTHGRRSITSTADDPKRRRTNMELILKRQLKFKAADCAVMIKGHTHKLLVCKPEAELYLTDDGDRIKQNYTSWGQGESYIHPDARWYGNSGSFLKLYGSGISGYAEMAEYDPVDLGFLVLVVRDYKIVGLDTVRLDI